MSSECKYYWTGRSNDPAEEFGATLRYTTSGGFEFSENTGSGGYSSLKNELLGLHSSGGEMSFLNQQGTWKTLSAGKGIVLSSGVIEIQTDSCVSGAVLTAVSGGAALQWKIPDITSAVMNSAIASAVSGIPDSLSDLNDVTVSSVSSGNVLMYNGTAWVPDNLPDTSGYGAAAGSSGYYVSGCSSLSGRYAHISGSGSNAVYVSGGNSLCRNYASGSGYRWEIISSSGNSQTILAFQTSAADIPEKGEWDSVTVHRASLLYEFPLNSDDDGKIFSVHVENGSAYAEMVDPGQWDEKHFFIGSSGNCTTLQAAASSAGTARRVICTLLDSSCSGSDPVFFSAGEVVIARNFQHESASSFPVVSSPICFRNMGNIVISGVEFRFPGSSGLVFEEGCHGRLEDVSIISAGSALSVKDNSFVRLASRVAIGPGNSVGISASSFGTVYAENAQLINCASSACIPAMGTRGNGGAFIEYTELPSGQGIICSSGGVMTSAGFQMTGKVVSSGEVMTVAQNGSAVRPVIQSGGTLIVSSGGVVRDPVLSGIMSCVGSVHVSGVTGSSGSLDIGPACVVSNFNGYGSVVIHSTGILTSSIISGGRLTVESKGSAFLVDVISGTNIIVRSGGMLVNRNYEGDTYTSDYIVGSEE